MPAIPVGAPVTPIWNFTASLEDASGDVTSISVSVDADSDLEDGGFTAALARWLTYVNALGDLTNAAIRSYGVSTRNQVDALWGEPLDEDISTVDTAMKFIFQTSDGQKTVTTSIPAPDQSWIASNGQEPDYGNADVTNYIGIAKLLLKDADATDRDFVLKRAGKVTNRRKSQLLPLKPGTPGSGTFAPREPIDPEKPGEAPALNPEETP